MNMRQAAARVDACTGSVTARERIAAVVRSIGTIREDIGREYSLRDLAQSALLSPFHFHRVFRQLTASTPARFWAAERMAEAKRLLTYTSTSVTDICMRVGYSSLGTFTTQFTRLVGVSPRRFRRLVTRFGDRPVNSILVRLEQFVPRPREVQVTAEVNGGLPGGIALVGLFLSGIPQGLPAACAIVAVPGLADFGELADGDYYPLAMSFHPAVTVAEALTSDEPGRCFVGASRTQIRIRAGRAAVTGDQVFVRMRPRRAIDPPVVLAGPLLLAAELTGAAEVPALVAAAAHRSVRGTPGPR